jgi:phosphatidate cytidylyltransferase
VPSKPSAPAPSAPPVAPAPPSATLPDPFPEPGRSAERRGRAPGRGGRSAPRRPERADDPATAYAPPAEPLPDAGLAGAPEAVTRPGPDYFGTDPGSRDPHGSVPHAGSTAVMEPAEGPAAPADHGRAGRNLPAAIGVGLLLGGSALASLFTRPEAFVALASLAIVLAVWELSGALAAKHFAVPVIPLAVGSIGMLVSAFVAGEEGLIVSFILTAFGVLLWRIIDGLDGAVGDVAAGLFTAAYVPFLAGFCILLLAEPDGAKRVITFIVVTVVSDIGGYFVGVLAGRHPMAPTVSPKKSWEGFAGSVAACLGGGVACVMLLLEGPWWAGLALGAATAVTATLGDLAESLVKRDLGVKDMGSLLPGHGGLMDRLDSLLPTAPVAYLMLTLLVPIAS